MARITNADRDAIRIKILEHAFGKQLETQLKAETDFAYAIYEEVLGEDLETARTMSKDWFIESTQIMLRFGVDIHSLNFSFGLSNGYDWTMVIGRPTQDVRHIVPYKRQNHVLRSFDYDDPHTQTFLALREAKDKLGTQIRARSKEIVSVLARFNTAEKLVKAWPEIETFLKPYLVKDTPPPLPVKLEDINQLLDLPPETSVAA